MKSVQVVFAGRAELAEGPTWYQHALWWVNIVEGTLNRWDPRSGLNTSRATAGFLGAATPASDGRWLLARKHDCVLLDWETGAFTPFASTPHGLQAEHRFNDGKVGPGGNFWVGTLSLKQRPHEAALYVLNGAGEFHRARTGLTLAEAGSKGAHSKGSQIFHTGIYVGNGWFIQSSDEGVALAQLTGWYKQKFAWGRRPLREAGLEP